MTNETVIQVAFDKFYDYALSWLDSVYALRSVTITNRDPPFVTPKIKSLLRKRNELMHKGSTDKADSLTKKITQSITNQAKTTFSSTSRGSKELWEKNPKGDG